MQVFMLLSKQPLHFLLHFIQKFPTTLLHRFRNHLHISNSGKTCDIRLTGYQSYSGQGMSLPVMLFFCQNKNSLSRNLNNIPSIRVKLSVVRNIHFRKDSTGLIPSRAQARIKLIEGWARWFKKKVSGKNFSCTIVFTNLKIIMLMTADKGTNIIRTPLSRSCSAYPCRYTSLPYCLLPQLPYTELSFCKNYYCR